MKSGIEITMKQVLDLMCQIVGEYGIDYQYEPPVGIDYQYEPPVGGNCVNWDRAGDCPSCLIGHIMFRLGVPKDFLSPNASLDAGPLLDGIAVHFGATWEDGVSEVLQEAQLMQDAGRRWGEALRVALIVHAEIVAKRFAKEAGTPKVLIVEGEV
jgi:hypothetical protein